MNIPKTTITEPLFCPRPSCQLYRVPPPPKWYYREGFHPTKAHGKVPRFKCKLCGKTFSTQTFTLDYYTKRRIDWEAFEKTLRSRASDRSMGRTFHVAPAAIQNRIDRLAKVHIAGHINIMHATGLNENLVADGFQTFVHSQDFPCDVTLSLGAQSQVAFSWAYAPLKPKGRLKISQRRARFAMKERVKAEPGEVERSFTEAVIKPLHELMSRSNIESVKLITDNHRAYKRAVERDRRLLIASDQWSYDHETVSTKAPPTFENPLYSAKYMDRELRKDLGNHVRETVTFARNPNDMMNRLTIALSGHNLHKNYRENHPHYKHFTHWQIAGVEWPALMSVWGKIHTERPWRDDRTFGDNFLRIWDRGHEGPSPESKRYRAKFWAA